jgi:hypothetical protein
MSSSIKYIIMNDNIPTVILPVRGPGTKRKSAKIFNAFFMVSLAGVNEARQVTDGDLGSTGEEVCNLMGCTISGTNMRITNSLPEETFVLHRDPS